MFPTATIMNYVFWMAFGAIQILVIAGLIAWSKEKRWNLPSYKIAASYIWFLLFCVIIAGGFTLHGEYEGNAGWYFIGVLGAPWIVVGAIFAKVLILPKKEREEKV